METTYPKNFFGKGGFLEEIIYKMDNYGSPIPSNFRFIVEELDNLIPEMYQGIEKYYHLVLENRYGEDAYNPLSPSEYAFMWGITPFESLSDLQSYKSALLNSRTDYDLRNDLAKCTGELLPFPELCSDPELRNDDVIIPEIKPDPKLEELKKYGEKVKERYMGLVKWLSDLIELHNRMIDNDIYYDPLPFENWSQKITEYKDMVKMNYIDSKGGQSNVSEGELMELEMSIYMKPELGYAYTPRPGYSSFCEKYGIDINSDYVQQSMRMNNTGPDKTTENVRLWLSNHTLQSYMPRE